MPLGESIFRRWQSGETDRQIAESLGWQYERLRSTRRRWQRDNPDRVRAIEREEGQRPETRGRLSTEPAPRRDKVNSTFTTEGNIATAYAQGRITTLEQLIEFCKIDLKTWRIDRWVCNKWEVGAKAITKDLEFDHGSISGSIESSGIIVEPLYQIKAWLSRRVPEPIEWPAIQAAHIELGPLPVIERPRRNFRRVMLFGDSQMGFWRDHDTGRLEPLHDRQALDIVEQIAFDVQPDEIHDLGDGSDLAEWSDKYVRTREVHFTTQAMIYERAWWYGGLRRAAPDAAVYVHEGNHDKRMPDAMAHNRFAGAGLKAADMREDWPVMSLPFLLGLRRMGIEWLGGYPDDVYWFNDALCCYHGDIARAISGDTVRALLRDTKYSQAVGHIHRTEMAFASRTDHADGEQRVVRTLSPGCTCRTDGAVPAKKKRNNWQKGLMIVDYDPGGTAFCPTFIAIENGRAMFNGEIYEARDRLEQLRDETRYAF